MRQSNRARRALRHWQQVTGTGLLQAYERLLSGEGTGLPPRGHSAISATERVKYAIQHAPYFLRAMRILALSVGRTHRPKAEQP
jgi:hypothetical protein